MRMIDFFFNEDMIVRILLSILMLFAFVVDLCVATRRFYASSHEKELFGKWGKQVYDLKTAALHGRADMVEMYIAAGKHLDQVNDALLLAARNGYPDTVRALMSSSRVDPNYRKGGPLMAAVREGHDAVVKELLSPANAAARADPNINRGSPLMQAISDGDAEMVALLGSLGSDLRINNDEPLLEAVMQKQEGICEFLVVERQADVNAQNGEPLRKAVRYGFDSVVLLLLRLKARPNERNAVALREAVSMLRYSMVPLLIQHGADPNCFGGVPLMIAIRKKSLGMVVVLLSNGADATINDNEPLIVACEQGQTTIAMRLVQFKADPKARDEEPLRLARLNNNLELIAFLESYNGSEEASGRRVSDDSPMSLDRDNGKGESDGKEKDGNHFLIAASGAASGASFFIPSIDEKENPKSKPRPPAGWSLNFAASRAARYALAQ